ncbi:MAG: hypothetical protein ACRBB0_17840 [Pelagimonas sp.]|uniref:hypothetical protein n=1 Tax=Pelagimonas sp. TaxID=2073170 RepID=UPI003D6A56B7
MENDRENQTGDLEQLPLQVALRFIVPFLWAFFRRNPGDNTKLLDRLAFCFHYFLWSCRFRIIPLSPCAFKKQPPELIEGHARSEAIWTVSR